jgi:competence protein ComEC
MGATSFAVFLAGALWLALWRGRVRLWGLVPALAAMVSLALLRPADILVSGDGQHVGITGAAGDRLLVLREGRSDFARDNLTEIAGMAGEVVPLDAWPGARCSADFCAMDLKRGGRTWHLLIGRGHDMVPERELAAACERVDIVISDRWLPPSCQPRMLKADRNLLGQTGGLAIDLANRRISTVAEGQGAHGWWRTAPERPRPARTASPSAPAPAPSGQ